VNQAAGGTAAEKPVTTMPALSDARQQAMPIIETPAQVVPLRPKKGPRKTKAGDHRRVYRPDAC
jgi:hypothetical protein